MKLYQKIGVGLLVATAIYGGTKGIIYLGKGLVEAETLFRQQEPAIVQAIGKTSPYVQTPVNTPLPKTKRQQKWYHNFAFVPINSTDIVYVTRGGLYLSKNKNSEQAQKIADDIRINQKYLFAFDSEGKGNPDIYWIDTNSNLRGLKNNNGRFTDQGVLLSLKDYFRYLPEHIELGDVNSDGQLDLIYGGKIIAGGRERNAINALIGSRDGLKNIKNLYYLGTNTLQGLIARDVDSDGDSDLVFKLQGNDREVFGLENLTKEGNNPAVFQNVFREKVANDDDFNFIFWYWFFFIPGGPGHALLFDD